MDMVRDIDNRHRGLPKRPPQMLFNVITKFYRGAMSHQEVIAKAKQQVQQAYHVYRETGDEGVLKKALGTLFLEFHFYVTCWLQVELALFRLSRMEETKQFGEVAEKFHSELTRHVHVRKIVDRTEESVAAQFERFGREMSCVEQDQYWFEGVMFTVDEESVRALEELYQDVMKRRTQMA
ncbi:hypothetical protein [Brevibacillus dissolubilis]|uniref:hypothetical protein n=1 Tax=Brevibacillus dissolubilis TaxID=1844116 RepID=UPI002100513C|nr:hypothetical protein [Brevibacillus dissolubilis]